MLMRVLFALLLGFLLFLTMVRIVKTQEIAPTLPRFVLDSRDGYVTVLRDRDAHTCYAVTLDHVWLGVVRCRTREPLSPQVLEDIADINTRLRAQPPLAWEQP